MQSVLVERLEVLLQDQPSVTRDEETVEVEGILRRRWARQDTLDETR